MQDSVLKDIIIQLCECRTEGTYFDFKVDYNEPDKIGKYLSSLSNAALLAGEKYGYLIYGVEDTTHKMVGTRFDPAATKISGNEDLIPYLKRMLTPHLDFETKTLDINGNRIVAFIIPAANGQPTAYKQIKYIRIESQVHRLDEYPEIEHKLWRKLETRVFETEYAVENINPEEIAKHIDLPLFFTSLHIPFPETIDKVLDRLADEKIITRIGKSISITNLGALLFANDLNLYPHLSRKTLRIIRYQNSDRLTAVNEWELSEGYVSSIQKASEIISSETPSNEIIQDIIRRDIKMYPRIAVREFMANALIHQDFWISGTGPMVEIFPKRLEITNPGVPLVSIDRLIDCTPCSRNERLARMMRRIGICEERGSGIDRAITEIEVYQLPAPEFRDKENSFCVTMYSYQSLSEMDTNDKIRACYQHCCLCYVKCEYMTNSTLRERFGIPEKNYPIASRIIKSTLAEGLIKIKGGDEAAGSPKYRKYIPNWG